MQTQTATLIAVETQTNPIGVIDAGVQASMRPQTQASSSQTGMAHTPNSSAAVSTVPQAAPETGSFVRVKGCGSIVGKLLHVMEPVSEEHVALTAKHLRRNYALLRCR